MGSGAYNIGEAFFVMRRVYRGSAAVYVEIL